MYIEIGDLILYIKLKLKTNVHICFHFSFRSQGANSVYLKDLFYFSFVLWLCISSQALNLCKLIQNKVLGPVAFVLQSFCLFPCSLPSPRLFISYLGIYECFLEKEEHYE